VFEGPKYGYFPLPSKTVLIVKSVSREQTEEIFRDTGVKISSDCERHMDYMGAVTGSKACKEIYVKTKVEKLIKDVEELAEIAKHEPQVVYASLTKAVSHRQTYVQQTIPGIESFCPSCRGTKRETNSIPGIVFPLLPLQEGQNDSIPGIVC
jgi:hypothetical protein